MPKTHEERMFERVKRINELSKIIDDAKAELMELTGVVAKAGKNGTPLPDDFPLQERLIEVLREKGQLNVAGVVEAISAKWGVRPDKKIVQSSLYFAKDKGLVERIGEGRGNVFYKIPGT